MTENGSTYSTEERIFSALAHAAIVLPYLGLIAPLIIWTTMREKSAWLRFQALQALAYQLLQFVLILIFGCISIPLFLVMPVFLTQDPEMMNLPVFLVFTMIIPFLPYLIWGLLILVGLAGGALCAFGYNFKYPLLGKRLEHYLDSNRFTSHLGGNHDSNG
jgi:uncharacterized Tic20 family protein